MKPWLDHCSISRTTGEFMNVARNRSLLVFAAIELIIVAAWANELRAASPSPREI
ncbi:MAG TPA: hypothetical protein VFH31_13890 [Pyrinomonadaceae bacterium]|nr:hypothetical protein [Pyrinomonadaceae bacterium]